MPLAFCPANVYEMEIDEATGAPEDEAQLFLTVSIARPAT